MTASILIVEDEDPIQILLTYNLQAEGFRVRATATGEEVQRLVGEERPDLMAIGASAQHAIALNIAIVDRGERNRIRLRDPFRKKPLARCGKALPVIRH